MLKVWRMGLFMNWLFFSNQWKSETVFKIEPKYWKPSPKWKCYSNAIQLVFMSQMRRSAHFLQSNNSLKSEKFQNIYAFNENQY